MKAILESHESKLISVMPQVKKYGEKLNYLTSWWDKVSLIGKINSHNLASIILDDMHQTKGKFSELHIELINNLLFEQFKKVIVDNTAKSQVTIDILIRNLFERTADIGFLATDNDIRQFILEKNINDEKIFSIKEHLNEYVKKYSVYDEVVILDPQGQVLVNQNNANTPSFCHSDLLQRTLESKDDYVETFAFSNLQPQKKTSLIYSCKITENNTHHSPTIGVLCLCFRFDDEMESIFNNLSDNSENILLLMSEQDKVISSSMPVKIPVNATFSFNQSPQLISYQSKDYIVSCSQSHGYQGFYGLGWWSIVMTPLESAFTQTSDTLNKNHSSGNINTSALFSNALKNIYKTSKIINDDLSLVVLNGQITSLKQSAAEFMPVLEAIKQIGESTASIFSDSIDDLQSTVLSSYMNDASFMSALAVNIMDRNLYERANDCRWWALTSVFQKILAQPSISPEEQQELTATLAYINNLYTVYTNLYLFDTNEIVIAVSNPDQSHLIGQKLAQSSGGTETLQLRDTQQYNVSNFIETPLYNDKHTYIYNAVVNSATNNKVVGGVGLVFDSEPEFIAILTDTLPKDEKGEIRSGCFAMFVDKNANIIATTPHAPFNIGDKLSLPSHLFAIEPGAKTAEAHFIQDIEYIVGVAASSGYREYKTTGDYENDVLAFTFILA